MFTELDWWGYIVIAALPLIGFTVGFRWARQHPKPDPPPGPATDPRLVDAVDTVQR